MGELRPPGGGRSSSTAAAYLREHLTNPLAESLAPAAARALTRKMQNFTHASGQHRPAEQAAYQAWRRYTKQAVNVRMPG